MPRAALLIADIGGYTKFMKVHRLQLAHAQDVVATLLEAVIDGAKSFKLAKLEGDAAFFWAPIKDDGELAPLVEQFQSIRRAFLLAQRSMVQARTCNCDSCLQIDQLTLKFVAHTGEVHLQKVKRHTELAGVDVIVLHRMLKNDVPVKEYVLMTDALKDALPQDLQAKAQALEHEFEGIGRTATHWVDLTAFPVELPTGEPSNAFAKLWRALKINASSVPYLLGLKQPCEGFQNLPEGTLPKAATRDEPTVTPR